jgi:hypothetical protein
VTADDLLRLANELPARGAEAVIGDVTLRFIPDLSPGQPGAATGLGRELMQSRGPSDADLALAGEQIMPDPEPETEQEPV